MVEWSDGLGAVENHRGNWLMYKIKIEAIVGIIIFGFVGSEVNEVVEGWEVRRVIQLIIKVSTKHGLVLLIIYVI